jgi:phosphoribosylaminoimidazolecarboxamide formyltransferase / IMP cyclohydrolase
MLVPTAWVPASGSDPRRRETPIMRLRYGLNPHQTPATVTPIDPDHAPLRVVHGAPSYLNVLDALAGWQAVRAASEALGRPAAASYKHISPAGVALAGPLDRTHTITYRVDATAGALTRAYVRARDADPKSSYGDFVAVSGPVDAELADVLRHLACDGIIAPSFEPGTVGVLSAKKGGRFLVIEADGTFRPPPVEIRELYGLRFAQPRDDEPLTRDLLAGHGLPAGAVDDLLLGLVTLRYTQSNSVAYVRNGATIGIGAGQQSRVDCVRIAGAKADIWWQRRHPDIVDQPDEPDDRVTERVARQLAALPGLDDRRPVLTGVAFVSDGALPFRDNIDECARHGVRHIAEPGGSIRSDDVAEAAKEHGITIVRTGLRLFTH